MFENGHTGCFVWPCEGFGASFPGATVVGRFVGFDGVPCWVPDVLLLAKGIRACLGVGVAVLVDACSLGLLMITSI